MHIATSTRPLWTLDAAVEAVPDQQRADQGGAGIDQHQAGRRRTAATGSASPAGAALDEPSSVVASARSTSGSPCSGGSASTRASSSGVAATSPARPARLCTPTPADHAGEHRRQFDARRAAVGVAVTGLRPGRLGRPSSIGSDECVRRLEFGTGEQLAVQLRRMPQLGVGALGDDAALVEHEHSVGQAQRRRAVGDQDRRARAELVLERAWIASSVRASIADVASSSTSTARVGQRGASERDALALPARQRVSALADHRVVAVRQSEDELVGLGDAGGCLDLGVAGVGAGEGDVLPDGRREQEALLEHDVDR